MALKLSTTSAKAVPNLKELILTTTIFKVVHVEISDDCHLVDKYYRTILILAFLESEFILQCEEKYTLALINWNMLNGNKYEY